MSDKKYYWLKLHKDFFKRHEIRIIESMDNGKDYILFYLKLLVESVSHEGKLRFSELIPYNEQMLASITNTNIDVVRTAMKIFKELGMIEVLSDETIFMAEVNKMIGSETDWAIKKREYRNALKDNQRTNEDNVRQEIRDKSIEIRDKNILTNNNKGEKSKRFIPPSVEEVKEYILEKNYHVDAENFVDFYESKGWYVGKNKMKDWKRALNTWERRNDGRNQRDSFTSESEYRKQSRATSSGLNF